MKTYQFRFESRPCEFRDGFVSVSYMMFSNEDQGMLREDVELTWPQAQTYFKEFVERTVGPRGLLYDLPLTPHASGLQNLPTHHL